MGARSAPLGNSTLAGGGRCRIDFDFGGLIGRFLSPRAGLFLPAPRNMHTGPKDAKLEINAAPQAPPHGGKNAAPQAPPLRKT
eukprot:gene10706-biopygen3313